MEQIIRAVVMLIHYDLSKMLSEISSRLSVLHALPIASFVLLLPQNKFQEIPSL